MENGSVQNFNLTNNHLNATFDFVLKAENPNRRISVYYDYIESTVMYEDQTIAFTTIDPFYQPRRNVTRVESKLVAQSLSLSQATFKDMRIEKTSGEIEVDVHFKARIRLKVGVWKSDHRTLRITCSSVAVHFSWYKHFDKVPCEVEV
ncbi:Late embryogenesis abundant protein, LEA-14 [Corchorus olitorius]|uniref:Late embryogenesis abundant protein, LEA-14 n=1 Tax=Corchorus olitorius TaxID=93759 RepID=A0A1R3J6A2_9ROSI|nr:Late embryogenesis abundant protein, LEA-14 [Corchorus olitorius]